MADDIDFSFLKKIKFNENIFLIVTAIFLILFQVLTYLKGCLNFYPFKMNMLLLYIFLLLIIPIKYVKNKQVKTFLYVLYIAYFLISLGFFADAMLNPNLNCTNTVFIDMADIVNST